MTVWPFILRSKLLLQKHVKDQLKINDGEKQFLPFSPISVSSALGKESISSLRQQALIT
jgi:hypothetical protein